MKLRISWYPWVPLIAGVLCGFSAVFFMHVYIQQAVELRVEPSQSQTTQPTRTIVVANRPLTPGELVVIEALSLRHVHPSGLAADAFSPEQLDVILGQVVRHPVLGGQPLQAVHLEHHSATRLADTLAAGTRAFTLSVSAEDSNAGLIQLGDKVDFYDLSMPHPRPVAHAVEVIATGTEFHLAVNQLDSESWRNEAYRTLTFAIDTAQLGLFSQLQRQQHLGFWLRPKNDHALVAMPAPPVEWIVGRQLIAPTMSTEIWQ